MSLCFLQLSVAAAQTAESAETQYRAHIQRALQEYGLGHWSEARAFFLRAHELTPSARTLRGIGLASYEMRDYVAAIRHLQLARSDERQPLTDTMQAEAKRQIDEAQSFIAHCKVSVEPAAATVKVDGEPAHLEADGTLLINPGDHEILFEADGYESARRTLTVNGGERPELRYALRRVESAPAMAMTKTEPAPPPSTVAVQHATPGFFTLTPVKIVGIALAGGAVVAAGVGTGFAIAALNDRSASNRDCDASGCGPGGLALRERALSRADVATVSFASAGALLVAGALTFVLAPNKERSREPIVFAPRLGLGAAGLSAEGAF